MIRPSNFSFEPKIYLCRKEKNKKEKRNKGRKEERKKEQGKNENMQVKKIFFLVYT